MKNVHIIPTKLASEYYVTKAGVLGQSYSLRRGGAVHVYITNDEEIKKGDWFITTDTNEIHKSDWVKFTFNNGKKITLTSDQDLIKDGVQAIDDEFLVWFVKNPNWIEVEVEMTDRDNDGYGIPFGGVFYKIIIPKEEPKQDFPMQKLIDIMENDEELRPKKETIEEAAENYAKQFYYAEDSDAYSDFIKGAKWQQEQYTIEEQHIGHTIDKLDKEYIKGFNEGSNYYIERMYSEEDLREAIRFGFDKGFCSNSFNKTKNLNLSEEDWFKQFKKK